MCGHARWGCQGYTWCNRLDLWTTGVMVLGKTKDAARRFMMAMERGAIRKTYRVCSG